MSQFQYRNKNQNFISNFVFQFIKKAKSHFGYTDFRLTPLYGAGKALLCKVSLLDTIRLHFEGKSRLSQGSSIEEGLTTKSILLKQGA